MSDQNIAFMIMILHIKLAIFNLCFAYEYVARRSLLNAD
jgi:hypothetical protein